MRASECDIGWYWGFELGLSVEIVMRSPVGSPHEYPNSMFLGLALGNSFDIWEGCIIGVSLGTLTFLMMSHVEGSLVGLSLVLPIGSPL